MEKNNTHIDALEQMRNDMDALRSLLNEQQIVNERLIRRAMNNNMSSEKRDILVGAVAAVLLTPVYFVLMPKWGMPLWFVIFTMLFMLTAAVASLWSLMKLSDSDILSADLVSVASRVVWYKRFGNNWLRFSIPVLVVWIGCFMYYAMGDMSSDARIGFVCGAAIGAVVGLVFGLLHLRKSRQRMDGILRQIDELKGTNRP